MFRLIKGSKGDFKQGFFFIYAVKIFQANKKILSLKMPFFLTESADAPTTVDAATMRADFYPTPDDFHSHYEVDAHSWYNGGRNLFDSHSVEPGSSRTVAIAAPNTDGEQKLVVCISASKSCKVQVEVNDSVVGTVRTNLGDSKYIFGCRNSGTFTVKNIKSDNAVKLTVLEGAAMRLDYITLVSSEPRADFNFY